MPVAEASVAPTRASTSSTPQRTRVLVTGANGFVGAAVVRALAKEGECYDVVAGTRRAPITELPRVPFDLDDLPTVAAALDGVDVVVYLVHGLERPGFGEWERETATSFATLARAAGVAHVVYLGGLPPSLRSSRHPSGRILAPPSPHMEARAATGVALAAAAPSVLELRTGIIIGAGGASFRMLRDVAVRCPVVAPAPWLAAEHQPVAVDDVARAIVDLLAARVDGPHTLDLAGPTTLPAESLLRMVARMVGGSMSTMRLSIKDHWLPRLGTAVCRTSPAVVRALLGGATGVDYVATGPAFTADWQRTPLEVALADALIAEERLLSSGTAAGEAIAGALIGRLARLL